MVRRLRKPIAFDAGLFDLVSDCECARCGATGPASTLKLHTLKLDGEDLMKLCPRCVRVAMTSLCALVPPTKGTPQLQRWRLAPRG